MSPVVGGSNGNRPLQGLEGDFQSQMSSTELWSGSSVKNSSQAQPTGDTRSILYLAREKRTDINPKV